MQGLKPKVPLALIDIIASIDFPRTYIFGSNHTECRLLDLKLL